MIKLICNKRPQNSKNITEGREYEGSMLNNNGVFTNNFNEAEYFVCVNDRDAEARYKISLFNQIVEEVPELPKRTYDDIIGLLKCNASYHSDEEEMRYGVMFNNELLFNGQLYEHIYNELSCGILQLTHLTELIENVNSITITQFSDGVDLTLSGDQLFQLKRHIIKSIFVNMLDQTTEQCECRFIAMSNTAALKDLYWDILDELSITNVDKNSGVNPNSGNEIAFWVFRLEDGE